MATIPLKKITICSDHRISAHVRYEYYIKIYTNDLNRDIAKNLNITPQKLAALIKKHNGEIGTCMRKNVVLKTHAFPTWQDAFNCAQELENIYECTLTMWKLKGI